MNRKQKKFETIKKYDEHILYNLYSFFDFTQFMYIFNIFFNIRYKKKNK